MKKVSIPVSICLLLCLVIISGCSIIVPNLDSAALSEPVISNSMNESVLIPDNSISPTPADSDKSLLKITSNGKTTLPYLHYVSETFWTENGWVAGDGYNLITILPRIAPSLPTVIYNDDFSVQYKEGVYGGEYWSIFDDGFKPLFDEISNVQKFNLSYLKELPEGTYYVGIAVGVQGNFIESENKYEDSSYSCVFKLVVNS